MTLLNWLKPGLFVKPESHHQDNSYPELNSEQKKLLLTKARLLLQTILSKTAMPIEVTSDLLKDWQIHTVSLDVTLWTGGQLRGSRVVTNLPLLPALHEAIGLATHDCRFKPLSATELSETRIEITLIDTRLTPLTAKELADDQINPELAYVAEYHGKREFFVPAVFNCQRFYNLKHLLGTLYAQKLGCQTLPPRPKVYLADVIDFLEPADLSRPALTLIGPIVTFDTLSNHHHTSLQSVASSSLKYLKNKQEPDGNLPPTFDPLTGQMAQIDWVRLAHASYALLAYGQKFSNQEAFTTGRLTYDYLLKHLYERTSLPVASRTLAFIYLHQAAGVLLDTDNLAKSAEEILAVASTLNYEPILYCQLTGFYLRHQGDNDLSAALSLTKELEKNFNRQRVSGQGLDLASYADLIWLFKELGERYQDTTLTETATNLAKWYINQQLPNGAFPVSTNNHLSNTRSTGKILESLTGQAEFSTTAKTRCLNWLSDRQYRPDNLFFVPSARQTMALGGIRHDDLNPTIWIDSISHLLLATAKEKTTAT